MFDVTPLPVRGHDLEGGDRLAPENRDGTDVCGGTGETRESDCIVETTLTLTRVSLHPHVFSFDFVVLSSRVAVVAT